MTEHQPAPGRTFRVIAGGGIPPTALTWETPKQRNRRLRLWRGAIFSAFGGQGHCLRVAWVLADLFLADGGYAYASDPYLAVEAKLPLNKLQAALTALDRGAGIIRSHVIKPDGKSQRRIYPASTLIPPNSGGMDTPRLPGGQILNRRTRTPKSQQVHAALDAKRREARESRDREKDRNPTARDDEGEGS